MISGIYSITSPSGKQYLGSATNFSKRWAVHLSLLKKGTHHSSALQAAYNKYGEENLVFSKLLICSKEDLIFYEQRAIDVLKPIYNMNPVAGSRLGAKFAIETKTEMSRIRKGFKQSPETIAKRTAKNTGKKRSPESIARYVAMRDRIVLCVETKQEFRSGKAAGDWCREQGLTKNQNAFVIINRAIRLSTVAYGYHWRLL